ncbi:MAG TPA: hypothetical protein DHV22_14995, partial [Xanthomarina gelatinilytica]|nr:hypothetical protein [Xanthomarina gelatinilytica]
LNLLNPQDYEYQPWLHIGTCAGREPSLTVDDFVKWSQRDPNYRTAEDKRAQIGAFNGGRNTRDYIGGSRGGTGLEKVLKDSKGQ